MDGHKLNRILFIAGGLLLSIMLGFGGLVGDFGFQGMRSDAASRAYLEANLPPIISTWSVDALLERASPEFSQVIHVRRRELEGLFQKLRALGTLQGFGEVEGRSNVSLATLHGKAITAHYVIKAIFTRGTARLTIHLLRLSGGWKFQRFSVSSPILNR